MNFCLNMSFLQLHQALWNYTLDFIHRLGNKTILLEHYRRMVEIAKERMMRENRHSINLWELECIKLTSFFLNLSERLH